jgi:hypothetical protein
MTEKLPAKPNRGYLLQRIQNTKTTHSIDGGEFFLEVKEAGT